MAPSPTQATAECAGWWLPAQSSCPELPEQCFSPEKALCSGSCGRPPPAPACPLPGPASEACETACGFLQQMGLTFSGAGTPLFEQQ